MRFHPLKAGRRRNTFPAPRWSSQLFPSPQGGSETLGKKTCHKQKLSFHPLKAGRRLAERPYEFGNLVIVSIPSRRVGDRLFIKTLQVRRHVSIPSRRVGDPPFCECFAQCCLVSIPSRRVGDAEIAETILNAKTGFHPLKAGRRPRENEGKGGQKGAKGREGCRRPSVGGKS